MIALGIVFFALTLLIDLITDYSFWLKKRTIDHARGVWLRSIGLTISIIWFSFGGKDFSIESLAAGAGMVGFWWWFLFDGIFAKLIGQKFFYSGTTAKIDIWFSRFSIIQRALIKIGGVLLFTVLYIFIL